MMIFAVRTLDGNETLVEFPNWSSWSAAHEDKTSGLGWALTMEEAAVLVKHGMKHETGLYLIDDEVSYSCNA